MVARRIRIFVDNQLILDETVEISREPLEFLLEYIKDFLKKFRDLYPKVKSEFEEMKQRFLAKGCVVFSETPRSVLIYDPEKDEAFYLTLDTKYMKIKIQKRVPKIEKQRILETARELFGDVPIFYLSRYEKAKLVERLMEKYGGKEPTWRNKVNIVARILGEEMKRKKSGKQY